MKRFSDTICYVLTGGLLLSFAGLGLAALIGTAVVLWGSLALGPGGIFATPAGLAEMLSYLAFAMLMLGCTGSFIVMAAKLRQRQFNTLN